VFGEGKVEDVTTHSATAAMVDEYARWYDRHFDPELQDVVLTPPDPATGRHVPWGYVLPKSADDLTAMARCFCATTFPTADAAYPRPERRGPHLKRAKPSSETQCGQHAKFSQEPAATEAVTFRFRHTTPTAPIPVAPCMLSQSLRRE
jgi:hypothetical protein